MCTGAQREATKEFPASEGYRQASWQKHSGHPVGNGISLPGADGQGTSPGETVKCQVSPQRRAVHNDPLPALTHCHLSVRDPASFYFIIVTTSHSRSDSLVRRLSFHDSHQPEAHTSLAGRTACHSPASPRHGSGRDPLRNN